MLITPTQLPLPLPDNGYLLIEPSNLPDEMRELLPDTYPCVPSFLWAAEASMPRLLKLGQLTPVEQEAVSQILAQATSEEYPPVICAWLQSHKNTEELAGCIARFILCRTKQGGKIIWRYYDPRVFVLLAHVFTEDQGNSLLGEFEHWSFPWRKQWWHIQRTQPFAYSINDLERGWPTSSQWDLLDKSREFHRIHSRLHEDGALPVQCLRELKNSIAALLETANYIHSDNDEAREEFVYLSTRYRKLFRENYEHIKKIEALKKREITLQQLLSMITSEDIELMEFKRNESAEDIWQT